MPYKIGSSIESIKLSAKLRPLRICNVDVINDIVSMLYIFRDDLIWLTVQLHVYVFVYGMSLLTPFTR